MEEFMIFIKEQLPEIIMGALVVMSYISQFFTDKKVKKNYNLFHNITKNEKKDYESKLIDSEKRNAERVEATIKDLNKAKEELQLEKERILKEHEQLKSQVESLTKACQVGFANTKDLVKSGVAAEVLKIIPTKTFVEIKKGETEYD